MAVTATHLYGQRPWAAEVPDVDALLRPPAWQRDALCREHPDVNWFPERGEDTAPAKAICDRCLVQAECLAFVLEHRIEHGIWAATSARQRRVMRGER